MNIRKYQLAIIGLVALVAAAGFNSNRLHAQALPANQDQPDGPQYRPGEVLVKFRSDVTDPQIEGAFRGAGLQMLKHIVTGPMRDKGELGITRALTAMPVAQAVELLNRLPGVEYAQPNWLYTHDTANDPYFTDGSLWGMLGPNTSPQRPYGSGAASAWARGLVGSKGVYIGVIDEGIQYNHPDLSLNMWRNPGEQPDGADNDGNGFVDDLYGWNGVGDNGNIYDATYDDHGTHVAGTVGAAGGNALGVVGVNWTVNLISGKFLGPNNGATSDAIQVIDYMTDLKTHGGLNIVALNNSWGGGGYDPALLESIVNAAKAEILFVAASGNGDWRGRAINTDSSPNYPSCYNTTMAAGYDSVIAVTSIDVNGSKASSANYGATTVDLGAPGVGVYSTLPGSSYGSYSGTSMATPHVTGAIGLYAAKYPGAKASSIRKALLASTTPTSSLSGKTVTGGRLDIPKFLAIVPEGWTPPDSGPPAAPTGLAVSGLTSTTISLSWTDNSNNETSFVITRTGGATPSTISIGANLTSYTDTGLTPNTAYTYSISACKDNECVAGTQPASVSVTTSPPPPPANALFLREDTVSKGTWLDNYGSDGYDILNYKDAPAGGTVTPSGYTTHTWASSTSDTRALQTPTGSSRFAACYYSATSFTIDLNFTDGKTHTVSLYCVDYDRQGRTQTIQIFDRNAPTTPLDEQPLTSFAEGKYLTWSVRGPILIKVIYPGGTQNAVVSGIFVDPPVDAPPAVSFSSPSNGDTVAGTITLTASATDDAGVSQVEFFTGSTSLGLGTTADNVTWSATWNTAAAQDGSYQLTARATDTAGQATTSPATTVLVDNIDDLPFVAISSPANGATVSGTVQVTAIASDDRGVSQVLFYVGENLIGADPNGADGWSASWDTIGLGAAYVVSAVAIDTGGQSAESEVTVTVDNTLPTSMHCGDLDGTRAASGSTWSAAVTVTIHDEKHNLVENATVTGSWSGGFTGPVSAKTSANGQVVFQTGSIAKNKTSVSFSITTVTGTLAYDSGSNHDADGDSNGTTITIAKP